LSLVFIVVQTTDWLMIGGADELLIFDR